MWREGQGPFAIQGNASHPEFWLNLQSLYALRVAETGSHRELLDKCGLYAHLVSRQLASASGVPA